MGTVIVSVILLAIVTAIIVSMVKKHKANKKSGGCGCGCSGCNGNCH